MTTNNKINAALRRAAGRTVTEPAPQVGAGSADGGAGRDSQPRAPFRDMFNRLVRDKTQYNKTFGGK
jgi:hypothetical protein